MTEKCIRTEKNTEIWKNLIFRVIRVQTHLDSSVQVRPNVGFSRSESNPGPMGGLGPGLFLDLSRTYQNFVV